MGTILKKLASTPTRSLENDYGLHLDLSYITKRILVCSAPVSKLSKLMYRNSLNDLINYLEIEHPNHWQVWNFKAESLDDYSLSAKYVHNKINHYPWPDHQAPPFNLLLDALKSIDDFLRRDEKNVAVIHCKMGKGRSGLIVTSYLMLYLGLSRRESCRLFTSKRMRTGFGSGVSILSQLKYLEYCELYVSMNYTYLPERSAQIECLKVYGDYAASLKINCEAYEQKNGELRPQFSFSPCNMRRQKTSYVLYKADLRDLPSQDIRLIIEPINRSALFKTVISTWLNVYWELQNLKTPSLENDKFSIRIYWDETDGFKGTQFRGKQLFEFIHVIIKLS